MVGYAMGEGFLLELRVVKILYGDVAAGISIVDGRMFFKLLINKLKAGIENLCYLKYEK